MKTLDEAIYAFEQCTDSNPDPDYDSCAECPYCDAVKGCCLDNSHMTDALHYLKEYRKTVTNCNQMRTGRWIPVDSETVNGRCSVCGYESHLYENDVYGENYCPHCGARLERE